MIRVSQPVLVTLVLRTHVVNISVFLDADDVFLPGKLQLLYSYLTVESYDFIFHDEVIVDSFGSFIESRRYGPPIFLNSSILYAFGNRFSTSTVTISRSFLQRERKLFDESSRYRIVEDYLAWTCLLSRSPRLLHLPHFLSQYRVHSSGISQASYRSLLNERHVLSYLFSIHFVGQYFLQNIARCNLLIRSSRVRSSLSLNSILFGYPFSFFLLLLFSISRRTIFFFYYLFR